MRTTMSAPKYPTRIYWSDDDEAFVAEVPSLPGCVSHGDTLAEAAANAQEAIELWLESAGRHGDGIPEPDCVREGLIECERTFESVRTGCKAC